MKKILIIGCGQLGSRHLQSLGLVKQSLEISIVDPSEDSLRKAQEVYKGTHAVLPSRTMAGLKDKSFSIIIVASSSDVRMNILRDMKSEGITYDLLILEKVLFPVLSSYKEALDVCDPEKTFVNCPKRLFPYFQKIKNDLKSETVHLKFSGIPWGLACNTIHFIDLVNYFTGELPLSLETKDLNQEIIPSKRPGFIEFNGQLSVRFNKGSQLELISLDAAQSELSVDGWKVNEKENFMTKNGSETAIRMPFQSELTAQVVNEFLTTGNCQLTPLRTSVECHVPMMKAFIKFHNQLSGQSSDEVKIT